MAKHKEQLFRQEEVNYQTVSPQTGINQCANCRFFCPSTWDYSEDQPYVRPAYCAIVEEYPLHILPTGWCDRHEQYTEPLITPMEVVIVEEEKGVEHGYIAPPPARVPIGQRIFGRRNPPVSTIYKGADGLRRMLIITSNGYKDRENEHVSEKALARYVERQYDEAGNWIGKQRFMFYHRLDIGEIVAADMVEGFLVEVAKEREGILPRLVWDYMERTAAEGSVTWGSSHGFKSRLEGDTYHEIEKQETTALDIEDAANLYTYSGVLPS